MPSSKSRGHFRKKPGVVRVPVQKVRKKKETTMEKTPEKDPKDHPFGPPKPPPPGNKPAEEPQPSHGPHWHEGDPEPKDEED